MRIADIRARWCAVSHGAPWNGERTEKEYRMVTGSRHNIGGGGEKVRWTTKVLTHVTSLKVITVAVSLDQGTANCIERIELSARGVI